MERNQNVEVISLLQLHKMNMDGSCTEIQASFELIKHNTPVLLADPKMAADLKQKLELVEELLKKYKVIFCVRLLERDYPKLDLVWFHVSRLRCRKNGGGGGSHENVLFARGSLQNLWEYWETYKVLVETSANPEYLLIVDAWQQLKFLELQQLKQ